MAHEITIRQDNTAEAFYADKPAWHELGTVVEGAKTSEEAIKLAQLDWKVYQCPVYAQVLDGTEKKMVEIKGTYQNTREDNNLGLGLVKGRYKVIQNSEVFPFVDSLINEGQMVYESAGSLRGGAVIWLLARFPKQFVIGATDVLKDYILCTTSHDGSHPLTIMSTNVRVVCRNTLVAALEGQGGKITIRHTEHHLKKTNEARKVLNLLDSYNANIRANIERMVNHSVNEEGVTKFLDKLFPMSTIEEDQATKTLRIREKVLNNFNLGVNQQLEGSKGTAWGLLNSVTEYVDHQRTTRKENSNEVRFESAWFGSGNQIKNKAFKELCNV